MDLKSLGWMIGEDCGEVDLNMDLSFPASVLRRAVKGGNGDAILDGLDDGVSGDLRVLVGDAVLDLEYLLKGFMNRMRCDGDGPFWR